MRFGTSYTEDRQNAAAGSGGKWIKGWKSGETKVWFLEELNDWTTYYEHFNQSKQRFYPCTGDKENCPGCTSDVEDERSASKRYLVNCRVGSYVDLYKIPASLIDSITRAADRDSGSLMKRPFLVIKTGKGKNGTNYDFDREERESYPGELDEDLGKIQDHQEALRAAYEEVWGPIEDEAEAPQTKPRRRSPAKPKPEEPPAQKPTDDDPPSEPQPEEPGAEEEDEVLSEDQVRAMSADDLLDLYERCGIEVSAKLVGQSDEAYRVMLADNLINALAEE